MPWKLIIFILIFAVFLAFITFNLENRSDIVFLPGVLVLRDVPVFIIIFSSFVIGLFTTMPFIFGALKKHKNPSNKEVPKKLTFLKKSELKKPVVKQEIKNTDGGTNGTA